MVWSAATVIESRRFVIDDGPTRSCAQTKAKRLQQSKNDHLAYLPCLACLAYLACLACLALQMELYVTRERWVLVVWQSPSPFVSSSECPSSSTSIATIAAQNKKVSSCFHVRTHAPINLSEVGTLKPSIGPTSVYDSPDYAAYSKQSSRGPTSLSHSFV